MYSIASRVSFKKGLKAVMFFPANSNNATVSNADMDITKILKGNTSGVQHAKLQFSKKLEWEVDPLVISSLNHENTW